MVAGYIRLSKEDESSKLESESISNQREIIKQYCEKNNLEIYKFYVDDGYTGANFERPDFKKLIEDIKSLKIDMVVTKDTSRLGRDFIETSYYIFKYFPENNIRYVAITENFDSNIKNGMEDIMPFKTILNDMYLKDISTKIKSVRHNKMKNGEYMGSCVPYGYVRSEIHNCKFEIDEYAAEVIKRIFNLRLEGKTTSSIARILTQEYIKPPNIYNHRNIRMTYISNIWKSSTISNILKNEIYIGNMIQRKYGKINYKSKKNIKLDKDEWIISENVVPKIIDKDIFEKVQKMNKLQKETRFNKYDYWLKGFVFCYDCRKKMTVRRKNNNLTYFCCKTNVTYRNKVCSLHYFNEKNLNEIVKFILKNILKLINKEQLKKIINKNYLDTIKRDKTSNNLLKIKNKIELVKKSLKNLYYDKTNKIITSDEFYILSEELKKDLEHFKLQENNIKQKENNKSISDKDIINEFLCFNNWDKGIISYFIDKIEIDENKKIRVYFNFNM